MTGWKPAPRLTVRLVCFAAACALLWPLAPWDNAAKLFTLISPFAAVCSSVALRAAGAGLGAGLLVAVLAVVRRRWFCRYACPAGLVFEGAANAGWRKTSWWRNCPPVGRYAALLTLAGAAAGYPVLLWMDPLSLFAGAFSFRLAAGGVVGALGGLGFGVLVALSLIAGPLWCARLCPLGGTQELLDEARARIARLWQPAEAPPVMTWGCLARRAFLLGAAGTGMGLLARRAGAARGAAAPLRPPGAIEEDRFTGLCSRCGNCVRACPSRILRPDTGRAGLAGLLAPVVLYRGDYCREDCRACTAVCASGAIRKMDLEEKRRYVIGEALVDGSLCLVTLGVKDCDACARACPFRAVEMRWDEELYVGYPLVDPEKCNGCGACEVVCPAGEVKAIGVWKRLDDVEGAEKS